MRHSFLQKNMILLFFSFLFFFSCASPSKGGVENLGDVDTRSEEGVEVDVEPERGDVDAFDLDFDRDVDHDLDKERESK